MRLRIEYDSVCAAIRINFSFIVNHISVTVRRGATLGATCNQTE